MIARRVHVADIAVPLAVALWAVALRSIDSEAMTDYGLVSVLPVVYFAAVAVLLVGFVAEVSRSFPSTLRLALVIVALVVVLHGTVAALFPLPHYSWVYKHLGVVRTVLSRGELSTEADIYGSWPGFFAAAAWVSSAAGVRDPTRVVAWAQVVFNVVFCLELLWLFRALRASVRTQWTAVLVFVLGNWVAQDYFAPQAVAYALSVAFFAVLFTWFHPPGAPRWVEVVEARGRRMLRSTAIAVPSPWPEGEVARPPVAAIVAFVVLFTAVVVSHPLTPWVLIASVAFLTVMGAVRPRWVLAFMVVVTVLYMVPRYDFVSSNYGIFHAIGSFFTNAQNNAISSGGLPGRLATAAAARILSAGVWGLAALGAVVRLRRGEPTLPYLALMVAPAIILGGQNYGGEAIFRVYLFSLPWAAYLAVGLFVAAREWRPSFAAVGSVAVAVVMAGLFLQAYFGGEAVNRTSPNDLAAATYFYEHAAPGSVLVLSAPNFPTRNSPDYDRFLRSDAASDPNLMGEPAFRGKVLGAGMLPRIERSILVQLRPGTPTYLVVGEGQRVYSDTYGILPTGSLDALDEALAASPRWRLFFRRGGAAVYEFVDAWKAPL